MITPAQIDRAKALLLDNDFRAGVDDAADRAIDRLLSDWSSGNPVVAAYVLGRLLEEAAARLTATATDHETPMMEFVGGQISSSAPMLRELLEMVGPAPAA